MAKVVIIGAGPAGMMAAIGASEKHEVTLIESNERIGKKLFITGKGRCNVTNSKDISEFFDYIPGNPHFLYSALYTYTNEHTMEFFSKEGIELKVERGGRVFPKSDKSSDIIKGLTQALQKSNVDVKLNSKVTNIKCDNNKIEYVEINNTTKLYADKFIIAAGGASYPLTGSTGEIHKLVKKCGHNIIELKPSLVPIEIEDSWVKELMGLSLKNVDLSIYKNTKKVYSNQGEMIFTHFGISGPLVLSGSRYINEEAEYKVRLDLKPALDIKQLDIRLQNDFKKYINKDFKNSLNDLLPQKIIPIIIKLSEINENKKVNEITKNERKKLVEIIKGLEMKVKKLRPLAEAIVTAGGVSTLEIDPSTMKSKKVTNLSFAGEIIDVDAFTGGYNVQIAISTGYLAGINV